MAGPYYISLDAGGSGIKTAVCDSQGRTVTIAKELWSLKPPPSDLPYAAEFDGEKFWNSALKACRRALELSRVDSKLVRGIGVTAQRIACVFGEKDGSEVYCGANRDARGMDVDLDEFLSAEEFFKITGHFPAFLFALSRLLWFRENRPDSYKSIARLQTLDGWLLYKFTGEHAAEISSAGDTGLLDIAARKWSEKIITNCALESELLPRLVKAGELIGNLDKSIAQKMGLARIPVTFAGGDTQASLIGAGASLPGDVAIVAGSTMPVQMVFDEGVFDSQHKNWSG